MAEPLTKKINDLPEMDVVAASNDKLLMLDVSESVVDMTKLVPMNLLSIHTSSQLAANTVGSSQIKAGAVTNSKLGADAVDGAKIADNAIGNEHIRDSAALSVIGRSSSTSGNPADIVAGADDYVLRRFGTTLGFGQVANAGIANGAVTNSKLGADAVDGAKIADDAIGNEHIRDSAALSVIGRSANSSGNPADIAAGADGYVLRRSGTTLGFGQVANAGIANKAVTAAKIADNTITASQIATNGVGNAEIANGAVSPVKTTFFGGSAIYWGAVAANGTGISLPSGWSASRSATGNYTVTHPYWSLNFPVVSATNGWSQVTAIGASFNVRVHAWDSGIIAVDRDFWFVLIVG